MEKEKIIIYLIIGYIAYTWIRAIFLSRKPIMQLYRSWKSYFFLRSAGHKIKEGDN